MIISFSVENWMSFRDKVTFSMVASHSDNQHKKRLPKIVEHQTLLPIAAIYGGNASGKTNFFKALDFAKKLVVSVTQPGSLIPVEPFRLSSKGCDQPSRFAFELLIDENIYEFSFALTNKTILEEKLIKITDENEKILYYRHKGKIDFDDSLVKDQFLQFAFQGTRDNQLFLTNSVSQKVTAFQPVYDWFKDNLILIGPDTRFGPFEKFLNEQSLLYSIMNEMLQKLDTGIANLGSEEIPFENIQLPEWFKRMLQEDVKEGMSFRLRTEQPIVISRKNGKLVAKKLITYHSRDDGSKEKFELSEESDGSQRVIDLLPAFLELSDPNGKNVYVIDEVDRSLHTLLTTRLVEMYLNNCSPKTRTQLLFTTHDILLIDQQFLRLDEMWLAERDNTGASSLISFSEYADAKSDKDIRKSYLQGRLGGIPRISQGEILATFASPSRLKE